jgi:hypothetical protein
MSGTSPVTGNRFSSAINALRPAANSQKSLFFDSHNGSLTISKVAGGNSDYQTSIFEFLA